MENEWGNRVVSEKLRADIHFNCMHDIFTFNETEGREDGITYTTVDDQPVITYLSSKNARNSFEFSIFDRFVQIGNSTICPFVDFRIDYVLNGVNGDNVTDNSTYFSVDSSGKFTIKDFSTAYTRYQVWVSVFNTMLWGDCNSIPGYLLEITIEDLDPFIPKFQPVFSEELESEVFINLASTEQFITYQLPEAFAVTDSTQTVTVTVNDIESFMLYDTETNTIQVDVSQIDPADIGGYDITINLEDEFGNKNKFTVTFHVYDIDVPIFVPQPEIVSPALSWDEEFNLKIVNISMTGLVLFEFNTPVREIYNWTHVNSSVVDIYIDPCCNRELGEGFNASLLNFTWQVQSIMKNYMFI